MITDYMDKIHALSDTDLQEQCRIVLSQKRRAPRSERDRLNDEAQACLAECCDRQRKDLWGAAVVAVNAEAAAEREQTRLAMGGLRP